MNTCGASVSDLCLLVCTGKQACRVPPRLAGNNLRDFTLTAFKAAVALTLHASGVLALFSPMGEWANWQIGGIGICRWCQCWIRQQWAQHAEQTPWRDALSWDLRWRSRKSLPRHVSRFFFRSRVDSSFLWLVANLFVTFISFCMIWKTYPDMLFLSFSNCMVGWLPSFRLVPCCFWEAANAVTYAYGISRMVFSFLIILLVSSVRHFLLHSNNCNIGCSHKVSEWAH